MTTSNQALALRTKLLVAEYGRKQVIAALARVENAEFDTIEKEVEAVRKKKPSRRRRPKALGELLKEAKIDPQTFPLVKRIACAYENKRYLPDLWRVKRFLESHGVDASKLRTRATALPLFVKVLGDLSVSELTKMEAESSEPVRGDLGVIADQILGSSKDGVPNDEGMARENDEREGPTRAPGVAE